MPPSSISELSSSSGRSWPTVFADFGKVFFILAICVYSIYSAYIKFSPLFYSKTSQDLTLRFQTDYSLCNPLILNGIDEMQCRIEIEKAFGDARTKCNGYIKNFQSCVGQYRDCSIQESNAKSCVSMVVRNELNQWSKIQISKSISIAEQN